MAKKIKCPDAKWFERLAQGQVSEQQELQLSQHLESCSICQTTVDKLSDLSTYITDGQKSGSDPIHIESHNLRKKLADIKSNDPKKSISSKSGYMDVAPWLDPSKNGLGQIDEFELLEFVGRGGMGVVFKCLDKKLERHVALKMMSPQLLIDEAASQRFLREARSAAKINHPNVVTVHSVNEIRGLPYLVMEFIEGESLDQRLKNSSLAFDDVLAIATQSISGLAAAHEQNVLHRDIKPANIMLDSRSGTAKIADFGLAVTAEGSNLTQTGFLVGTPDFVSPEQAAGETIDHRSDLFSLGSVLYAMCCGNSPFAGPSIMTILESVKSAQPSSIESINPSVPSWFRNLVSQLLQKDPNQRFGHAKQVLAVMKAQTSQVDDSQAPRIDLSVNRSIQKEKRRRQNKYVKSLTLVAAATLLLIGTVFWWFYSHQQNSLQTQNAQNNSVNDEKEKPKLQFVEGLSNQVIIDSFQQLKAAINLPEESITIFIEQGAELQVTEQLYVQDKNVTLVGDEDDHASIEIDSLGKTAFWVDNGSLTFQHLDLRLETESENIEDEDDAGPIISCHDGQLKLARSRIFNMANTSHCIELLNSSGIIENSQIMTLATAFDWIPTGENSITITDSVIVSPSTVFIDDSDRIELNLTRSTFIGEELFGFDGHGKGTVLFNSKQNLYAATGSFIHFTRGNSTDEQTILEKLQLNLNNDVVPPVICAITDDDDENSTQILFEDSNWYRAAKSNGCKFLTEEQIEEIDLEMISQDVINQDYDCIVDIADEFEGYGANLDDTGPFE